MSQAAVAGDEMSSSYISLIESDRRAPTAEMLAIIAERLQTSPDELLHAEASVEPTARLALRQASLALHDGLATAARDVLAGLLEGQENRASDVLRREVLWVQAQAYEACGEYPAAAAALEALRNDALMDQLPPSHLSIMIALTRCYRDYGDLDMAISTGQAALEVMRPFGLMATVDEVSLMLTLAGAYEERGDLLAAQSLVAEGLRLATQAGDAQATGRALWTAATTAEAQGNYALALEYSERGLAKLNEADNVLNLASLQLAHARISLRLPSPDVTTVREELSEARRLLSGSAGAMLIGAVDTELANCDMLEGHFAAAAAGAAQAAESAHGLDRARARLVQARATQQGLDGAQALVVLRAAAADLEALGGTREAAAAWREVAALSRSLGHFDLAIDALERVADCCGVAAPLDVSLGVPT